MKEANGRIFYLPCLMISEIENLFLIWDIHMLVCVLGSFLGGPKSLQMVTAAMKLKDSYSLKEKL